MSLKIKVGLRPSLLAFKQFEEIQSRLPLVLMNTVLIKTTGDSDKSTPLTSTGNGRFFTDEIEQALLEGLIDAAIHSAKDLEQDVHENLLVIAITKAVGQFDCLVSHENLTLDQLPLGATIGTSSQARKDGITRYRKDLVIKDIRGNVDDRLRQLDRGDFDAIIVADAALIRLGLQYRISQFIPEDIIKPHPLQGRLAIQIKKDRKDLMQIFKGLDEKE
ncbi:MAG: hydroxymethylbilane synthase [Omnitrophica WOR_2 bacterium RIFOXYC2_FULL_38_12]|nr:MAG: hydroxymethylbilane synthase [Omnitrophica WOR_2 bacterium RIFOXYC2_FULL_38_12]